MDERCLEACLELRGHTGAHTDGEALALLRATTGGIARLLDPKERSLLRTHLPPELSRLPSEAPFSEAVQVYEAVAALEHVPLAHAREETFAACQALARLLGPEVRRWLRGRLPEELATWLHPRAETPAPPPPVHLHESRHTLSSGRPGYVRPIADSTPLTQHDTVADENPHGSRKLSSGSPDAQEE